MLKRLLTLLLFLFLISNSALAQSHDKQEEKDPFKNDPFFSEPIDELLKRPDDEPDSTVGAKDEMRDFVTGLNDNGLDYEGALEAGPYKSSSLYSVYPNLPMIHYNRVNGLFLGLRKERMQWYHDDWLLGIPNIQPHGLIGYSFGQREWEYTLGVEKLIGRKRHVLIGGEYHNASATNDDWRVGLHETTITSFAAGYDYLDYYKQKGWGTYLLLRSNRFFEGGVAFNDDRYGSLNRETGWALFGAGDRYRVNPPVDIINGTAVDNVEISALTFSAAFNPKRLVLAPRFSLSLNGIAEFADPGLGTSEYKYQKYTGELISYINFEPGGILKYRFRMSSITGDAPRFKNLYLGGVGTLRALPYKSLGAGNQMLLSTVEMQFGTPVHSTDSWIDFDDFYLSLFLDSGWVDYEQQLEGSENPFSGFDNFKFPDLKHNGGIGIGSSLLRCELAWDLDHPGRAPVFWLRLNPTF